MTLARCNSVTSKRRNFVPPLRLTRVRLGCHSPEKHWLTKESAVGSYRLSLLFLPLGKDSHGGRIGTWFDQRVTRAVFANHAVPALALIEDRARGAAGAEQL